MLAYLVYVCITIYTYIYIYICLCIVVMFMIEEICLLDLVVVGRQAVEPFVYTGGRLSYD